MYRIKIIGFIESSRSWELQFSVFANLDFLEKPAEIKIQEIGDQKSNASNRSAAPWSPILHLLVYATGADSTMRRLPVKSVAVSTSQPALR